MSTSQRVKFGLNATNQFTDWAGYSRLCLEAEAAGLDSFWVFDHFVPGPSDPRGNCLECFTTISSLAAITKRIQLGTLVLGVTYRNPALVAKMGAMVDHISGGRFVLGMGAGWYGLEHEMYGIPFPAPGERVRREDEALAIIRSMWTEEEATFEGRYYTVKGARCEPKPTQRPHPPILVGGRGKKALGVAAKHASMWNSASDVAGIREQMAELDAACAALGRNPAEVEKTAIVLHAFGETEAIAQAKREFLCSLFRQPWEALQGRVLHGPPEQVAEQLQAYVDIGVTHFMMSMMAPYDLGVLRTVAEKVLPRLR